MLHIHTYTHITYIHEMSSEFSIKQTLSCLKYINNNNNKKEIA